MESDIAVILREYEDEGRSIGTNRVPAVAGVEADNLEVGIEVVLMNTVVHDVAEVSAVTIPKRYCCSMNDSRQSIIGSLRVDG